METLFMNLLPEEYYQKRLANKRKQKAAKVIKWVTLIALLGASVEAGIVSYYYVTRNDTVPPPIAQQYNNAQRTLENIKYQKSVYAAADRDDKAIIQALDTLTLLKPAAMNFTKVEVTTGRSVQVEGYATDPAIFNTFVEQINAQQALFKNAKVERITSTTGIYKNVLIKADLTK